MTFLSPRVLSVAVVLLLLVNTALVVYLVMGRSRYGGPHGSYEGREDGFERMARTLRLTEWQKAQQLECRNEFSAKTRPFYDSIRQTKIDLYARVNIMEETDSLFLEQLAKISQWQREINRLNYAQFKKMRSLLTPAQKPGFDSLVIKMIQRSRRDTSRRH